jgi:hypothetical protein
MSLKIDVKTFPEDFTKITRAQRRDVKRGVTRGISEAAIKGKEIIDNRTADGMGINGKFARYPKKYLKWLKAAGYPTTPVDLENEGDMLRSMQAKVTSSNEAMLYFDNATQAKKAAFNNRIRPFFGFNDKEEKRLADVFRKQLKL